jgi:N-acetyl sugar amidotransferase
MDRASSNKVLSNWVHYRLNPGEKVFMCKKCLTLSTRPRVQYSNDGVCNACSWAELKKYVIDWSKRKQELISLCDKYRRKDGYWDVLVPCSGGKDSAYIAWKLKHEYGMNPLLVTLRVPFPTENGKTNLELLVEQGFDHIMVTPNPIIYKKFMRWSFINEGRPKMPFEMGISLVTMFMAIKLGIPFIMYGEEGEEEYGGATTQIGKTKITRNYLINYYYNGHDPIEYEKYFNKNDLLWWRLPSEAELKKADLYPTQWSHFENWDALHHYEYIKSKYGFVVPDEPQVGTFTNYAQLDDKIQDLHAYMMYIKFGFGRAWSDACIEIRAGRMTREQGIEMIKKYDGVFPEKYLDDYLRFYDMTRDEFWGIVDSFRSPDIWSKVDGEWRLNFEIK